MFWDGHTAQLTLPASVRTKWQKITDTLATFINVPVALVMHLELPKIKVFVSSHTKGNPYHPNDSEIFEDSGLYCETVIKTQQKLLVPNALNEEHWKNNPDIKLNMISYLGYPLTFPNGHPFGTICILDSQENHYCPEAESLLSGYRENLQLQLQLTFILDYLKQQHLDPLNVMDRFFERPDVLPVCSFCRKIRDSHGHWDVLENYLAKRYKTSMSHTICPECYHLHYQ